MPYSPMPFDEFQQRRRRIMQKQISRGLAPYMLKYGLLSMSCYILGMVVFRLLRHRPLRVGHRIDDWLSYAIPALTFGIAMPVVNFYSIKRQLKKSRTPSSPSPAPASPAPGSAP